MNLESKNILILDADSIVSIIGAGYDVEPKKKKTIFYDLEEPLTPERLKSLFDLVDKEMVYRKVDLFLNSIFRYTGCTHYHGLLGACGSRCFRYDIAKSRPYKDNRKDKPFWMGYWKKYLNKYLVDKYGFQEFKEIEADDAVGIYATKYIDENIPYVIGAIDKDLKQIAGKHFNYKTNRFEEDVTELDGTRLLLKQAIKGDTIDNIPGLPGYGPKKIEKEFGYLDLLTDKVEMFNKVQQAFIDKGHNNFEEQFRLVYLLRKPEYDFYFKESIPVPKKEAELIINEDIFKLT